MWFYSIGGKNRLDETKTSGQVAPFRSILLEATSKSFLDKIKRNLTNTTCSFGASEKEERRE